MASTSNYIQKDSPIDRMHPMVKIYAIFFLGLSSVIFPHYILAFIILIFLFIVAYIAKLLGIFAKFVLLFAIPITVMLIFIQGLYSPKNVTIIADFGFAQMGLEGLHNAFKIIGNILVFLGAFFLMTTTTYTGKLVAALIQSGLNAKVGYLILASLNVVPQMRRRMHIVKEAQMARGVETDGGVFSRIKAFIPIFAPVIMSSLTDSQERGMTLETRGFAIKDVKPTTYIEVPLRTSDKVMKIILVVFFVAVVVASILMRVFANG